MKKVNKLAAAVGVALTLGIAAQEASALIEVDCCGGRGDAVIFPAFVGISGFENYYAITNDANAWVQGHLRFRGGAWCGELRDFDIILSPGDVFVFRLADVDGDGMWEIDQSLDERNFQYTGMLEVEDQGNLGLPTSTCTSATDGSTQWKCMDPSDKLIPTEADAILTEGKLAYQKQVGTIEFFGEAILTDMTHDIMAVLLSGVPGDWAPYQTDVFSGRGTSSWKWSNASGQFANVTPNPSNNPWVGNRGLSDVPNMLGGVGFISRIGMEGVGIGFNGQALVNFRTDQNNHRIENYNVATDGFHRDLPRDTTGQPTGNTMVGGYDVLYRNGQAVPINHAGTSMEDRAVIVHHENGASSANGISPRGDYIYQFREEDLVPAGIAYEGSISFNNTWGPTLADGDDYNMSASGKASSTYGKNTDLRCVRTDNTDIDDMDQNDFDRLTNSVAEVEEAIRTGGQTFTSYYFDGGAPSANHQGKTALRSWFFAFYPTKFFYGEESNYYNQDTAEDYRLQAARFISKMPKSYTPQVWDINENTSTPTAATVTIGQCVSPAIGPECFTRTEGGGSIGDLVVSECLSVFNIGQVKTAFSPDGAVDSFTTGRIMLDSQNNSPEKECGTAQFDRQSWPGFMYTFEWGGDNVLAHWRCLIK
ncbi:hypothetical protein [Candidatus Parabeggiatoa sp. HSG14]|uniref:hypothetical protein n=1 Tax=Candidatus Parabeggiatoa sp. HSG14 TaxID=3055593 RepID=UPI0025A8D13F|nr:hypothetical protein [Thiotrichales bacterium HSG14]